MSALPLVSVVVPSYNRCHTLGAAIASVQAGFYANWELIVVDDGSTDDTASLVERITAHDPRVRRVVNGHRSGPGGARDQGIEESNGELIAFLDSDDRWLPRKLELQLAQLAARPDVGMVAGDYWIVDQERDRSIRASVELLDTLARWDADELTRRLVPCERIRGDLSVIAEREAILSQSIAGHLWIQTSCVMIQREVLDDVGVFDEEVPRTEDIRLWLRINERHRIGYLNQPLAVYNITGRSEAGGPRYERQAEERRHSEYAELRHHVKLFRFIAKRFDLTAEQRLLLRRQLGRRYRQIGFRFRRTRRLASFGHYTQRRSFTIRETCWFCSARRSASSVAVSFFEYRSPPPKPPFERMAGPGRGGLVDARAREPCGGGFRQGVKRGQSVARASTSRAGRGGRTVSHRAGEARRGDQRR